MCRPDVMAANWAEIRRRRAGRPPGFEKGHGAGRIVEPPGGRGEMLSWLLVGTGIDGRSVGFESVFVDTGRVPCRGIPMVFGADFW